MSDRHRDRSPRGGSRFSSSSRRIGSSSDPTRRAPAERRVFVSNIPFEMKWQEVKDMFREHVGEVSFVELFSDEFDKSRGCGILEFDTPELAKKAVQKMHRYDYKGRKLVVKEDFDTERDRYGRISGSGGRDRDRGRGRDRDDHVMRRPAMDKWTETYGLSPEFLDSLGIDGPLHTRLFVANLTYDVDEKKLREVFRLAGRVVSSEINRDKDTKKSRGHGVVEFSHPVEAVQAISMLNNQMLFERKMTVRFDKYVGPSPEELDQLPSRLPDGLNGVGYGLGEDGRPLTNVAMNLQPQMNSNRNMAINTGNNGSGMNNVPNVADLANSLNNIQNVLATQMGMNMGGNQMAMGSMNANVGGSGGGSLGTNMIASLMGSGASGGGIGSGSMMGSSGSGTGIMGGASGNMMSGSGMGGGGNMMSGSGGGGSMMSGSGSGGSMMNVGSSLGSSMNDMRSRQAISNIGDVPATGSFGKSSGSGQSAVGGGSMGGYTTRMPDSSGSAGGNISRSNVGGGVSSSSPSDAIVIRNLPLECTWQNLRECFGHCGDIKYAEMKDRGIGLIRFASERDAERAVTIMHNQMFKGGMLDVRLF